MPSSSLQLIKKKKSTKKKVRGQKARGLSSSRSMGPGPWLFEPPPNSRSNSVEIEILPNSAATAAARESSVDGNSSPLSVARRPVRPVVSHQNAKKATKKSSTKTAVNKKKRPSLLKSFTVVAPPTANKKKAA
jgi:hypothetical protein